MFTFEFVFNQKKLAVETCIAHNPKMQASKQKADLPNYVTCNVLIRSIVAQFFDDKFNKLKTIA